MKSAPRRPAPLNPTPEYEPTFSLNRHVDQARREMGEKRWSELNREWEA